MPRPRPSTSPAARSRLPAQPPGGPGLRQRAGAAPQSRRPPGQAEQTPRKNNTRLILLVAALVGIILGATIGILAFTSKSPGASGTPTATSGNNIVGTVSFSAAGGLQGNISISLPKSATVASFIQKGPTGKVLDVVINNAGMEFELGLSPYPGPGSYNLQAFLTNPAPGSYSGTVRISSQSSSWSLHPPAQCQVIIASDVSLNRTAQNKPLDEVKGSFTCPTLAPDSGSAKSLAVTQGQFDVDALVEDS